MPDDLENMIQKFVSGEDTTLSLANRIEVAIDDAYPDDDYLQEAVMMLAQYRPGGGEFLHDTPSVQKKLTATLKYIRSRAGKPGDK